MCISARTTQTIRFWSLTVVWLIVLAPPYIFSGLPHCPRSQMSKTERETPTLPRCVTVLAKSVRPGDSGPHDVSVPLERRLVAGTSL